MIDATGAITTQNLVPAGIATAGGAVEIGLQNQDASTAVIQVVGTYTGILSIQATANGINWITLGGVGTLVNILTLVQSATIASATQGIFKLDVSGYLRIRVTALAAVTGTANIVISAAQGSALVGINTPLVLGAGAAAVGSVTVSADTPAVPSILAATSTASTNATSLKGTIGTMYGLIITNYSASPKFVKFYSKATAPTVGTDIPLETLEVAANSSRPIDCGFLGWRFTLGIGYAITGLQADTDTTAVAAGDVKLHGSYI